MPGESQLSDLLLQWEERKRHGESVAPDKLCADSPELVGELQRRIRALEALDPVLDLTSSMDDATVDDGRDTGSPTSLPTIPGYEVLDHLPEGGMGRPLKVLNVALNRVEVLKTIKPRVALRPRAAERFRLEMQAMAKLKHPHIVGIYDAREHAGQAYFTMEYVEGGTLRKHLRRLGESPQAAARLLAKVARAVHFVHTRGILHRDLKPENILVNQDEPLVSDFGLAKLFDEEVESTDLPASPGNSLTQEGTIAGTFPYLSPEAAAGQTSKLTAATDIWALGVILYEMLAGTRPFAGRDGSDLLANIQNAEPLPPRAHRADLDPDLEAICLQCLAKDPEHRFASAEELAARLERWIVRTPAPASRLAGMRRHPIASGAVAAGGVAVLIAVVAVVQPRYYPTEEQQRASLLAELATGQRVTLIPDRGPPTVFRWALRGVHETASTAPDRPFSVHAADRALVELLPRHPLAHYRVRLQVHQDSGAGESDAGIYFGYSEQRTQGNAPIHCLCAIAFNDVRVALKGQLTNQLRVNPLMLVPKDTGEAVGVGRLRGPPVASHNFPPAGNGVPTSWRTLTLDVRPEQIEVMFDEVALPPVTRAALAKAADFLFTRMCPARIRPVQEPPFLPQEALGLYVNSATVWFRSCTIEALPENPPM